MAKPTASDYLKIVKKLNKQKKDLLNEAKECDRKIAKANEIAKQLKNNCRHEYEYIICKDMENPEPVEETELKVNFPDINYRIKIDNNKLQFIYRSGKYEELVRFLTYYNIVLICKKCGSKSLLGIGCEEDVNLVIKIKSTKSPKKGK